MNALVDALAPFGIDDVPMPATGHAVWQGDATGRSCELGGPAPRSARTTVP